jgi:solute carrier family 25 (mitochondrial carnitine/acylcarnitine transporter), member 20/29
MAGAGLLVSMSRSAVVNAVFFSAFEMTKKRIRGLEVDEELLRRASLSELD